MSASKKKPEFDGTIKGWTVNYVSKNIWRVDRIMTIDDCLQEAQLVFLRVKRSYPKVPEGAHFMALFKTSWIRRFDDLSNENTVVRDNETLTATGAMIDMRVGEMSNEGELRVMIRQAPREVRMVLELMLRAPQEIADLAFAGWRKDRQKGSERINALLGLPSQQDTLQRVEEYFRQ